MKLVLDTNVLVSGMINSAGYPGKIVDLLRSASLEVVVDDRILAEHADVLRRERFRDYLSEAETEEMMIREAERR